MLTGAQSVFLDIVWPCRRFEEKRTAWFLVFSDSGTTILALSSVGLQRAFSVCTFIPPQSKGALLAIFGEDTRRMSSGNV